MNNKFIYTLYCAVWLVCCSLIVQGCTDEENVGATPDEGTLLRLSIADLEEVQVRGLAGESSAEYRTQCYDIFVYRGRTGKRLHTIIRIGRSMRNTCRGCMATVLLLLLSTWG